VNEAGAIARDVRATMKYVVRGEKATFYAGDRDKSYWPGEEHEVVFHDMRPLTGELSFDRNGFVLLEEPSEVSDFTTEEAIARYGRECEALIQRLTGAEKVVSFGPIIRTSASGTHGHHQPALAPMSITARAPSPTSRETCCRQRKRSGASPGGTCSSISGGR